MVEASSTNGQIKVYTDGVLRLTHTGVSGSGSIGMAISGLAGFNSFRAYRLP